MRRIFAACGASLVLAVALFLAYPRTTAARVAQDAPVAVWQTIAQSMKPERIEGWAFDVTNTQADCRRPTVDLDTLNREGLEDQIEQLRRSLASDRREIERFGFRNREAQFDEFLRMERAAQRTFEREVLDGLTDIALEGGFDGAQRGVRRAGTTILIGRLDHLNDVIGRAEAVVGPTRAGQLAEVFRLRLEPVINARMNEARRIATRNELIEGALEWSGNAADLKNSLTTPEEAAAEVLGWGLGPFGGILWPELKLVAAMFYEGERRTAAREELERMTKLTENQLVALKKVQCLQQRHQTTLNAARDRLNAASAASSGGGGSAAKRAAIIGGVGAGAYLGSKALAEALQSTTTTSIPRTTTTIRSTTTTSSIRGTTTTTISGALRCSLRVCTVSALSGSCSCNAGSVNAICPHSSIQYSVGGACGGQFGAPLLCTVNLSCNNGRCETSAGRCRF